jgi:hypothetical protein
VCKLIKVLYSLKQVLRVWYITLTDYLKTLGFTLLTVDNCIFYDNQGLYITVFIDDLLIIGLSKSDIDTVKAAVTRILRYLRKTANCIPQEIIN